MTPAGTSFEWDHRSVTHAGRSWDVLVCVVGEDVYLSNTGPLAVGDLVTVRTGGGGEVRVRLTEVVEGMGAGKVCA
jgi:hypothetical protein